MPDRKDRLYSAGTIVRHRLSDIQDHAALLRDFSGDLVIMNSHWVNGGWAYDVQPIDGDGSCTYQFAEPYLLPAGYFCEPQEPLRKLDLG